MSKMFYWGVCRKNEKKWPTEFHFRYADAKDKMHRYNKIYGKQLYFVKRFVFFYRGDHYDIYEHSFKRLKK